MKKEHGNRKSKRGRWCVINGGNVYLWQVMNEFWTRERVASLGPNCVTTLALKKFPVVKFADKAEVKDGSR